MYNIISFMCYFCSASNVGSQPIALWEPPVGRFSDHEATAILRHTTFVRVSKRISVQGCLCVGFNSARKFDSSAVWVSAEDSTFLCRVLNFIEVSPCCHEECEEELVAEVMRFDRHRERKTGIVTYDISLNRQIEYISASSILPKVVVLIPVIEKAPESRRQRNAAAKRTIVGPYRVIDVDRHEYQ